MCNVWIRRIKRWEEFKIPLCYPSGGYVLRQSFQTSTPELLCKNSQRSKRVDCFPQKSSTTNLWLDSEWGSDQRCVGGMQIHGTRGRKLVYKEVVEALLNYQKYYFWWCGNPDCGDTTGSNQIEKFQAHVPSRPAWEKRGEWTVWFRVLGSLVSYSRVISVFLVLSRIGPVLTSRYGIEWQKVPKMFHCFG